MFQRPLRPPPPLVQVRADFFMRMRPLRARMPELLGFTYEFVPGASGRTLLLLHGTGGDERDLLALGRHVAPADALLSPRGKVLEHGMPRFFRRLAEGVLDIPDLKARAREMAAFVDAAAKEHGFDPARVLALGYSNGANLASAILLERPDALAGAVLARAMPVYEPERAGGAEGKRVLLCAGRRDPYTRSPRTETLAAALAKAGASVETHWADAGHELTDADIEAMARWLA